MATEKQREKQIEKNIKKSAKKLDGVLSTAKRSITGAVSEFVSLQNFVTNRAVRDRLYAELGAEYKKLNLDINDWTVNSVNETARDFWGYAKEDLPRGAVGGTFGAFSSKYVNDIIAQINPAAVDRSVAMGAQIGGMHANDIIALRVAVSTTYAEGSVEGLTNKQMADRMREKIAGKVGQFQFIDRAGRRWKAETYFGMLNRTLHANAARDSYIATATNEAGFDLYQIEGGVTGSSVQNPNDPCDNWAGRIISMTGNTKGYPTYDEALAAGVFHPQCCVPETEVVCPDIQSASRTKYSGKMVKIKYASGNTLSVTPNHMLLTDQGFARADSIAKGDNILRRIEGQGLGLCSPDVEWKPAMIKDVFMSLRKSRGVLSAQVPVSAEDFHGDGVRCNGNIDVVFTNSFLLHNLNSVNSFEPVSEHLFGLANTVRESFLFSDSPCSQLLLGAAHATNRIVGGLGVGGSPVSPSELLSESDLFIMASDPYSCGNKGFMDSLLGNVEPLTDFIVSNSAFVELDNVVDVEFFSFDGHVYDLQSLSTLYYANGYLSSNCVHFVRAIMPSEIDEAKKEQNEERIIATELGSE